MSFLKNILRPFVEFEGDNKDGPAKDPKAIPEEKQKKPQATAGTSSLAQQPASSATTLAEYEKYFEELIEEANRTNPLFEGTDFKEFLESKTDVEAITDEATKYR